MKKKTDEAILRTKKRVKKSVRQEPYFVALSLIITDVNERNAR
jgi:hypothetical protein